MEFGSSGPVVLRSRGVNWNASTRGLVLDGGHPSYSAGFVTVIIHGQIGTCIPVENSVLSSLGSGSSNRCSSRLRCCRALAASPTPSEYFTRWADRSSRASTRSPAHPFAEEGDRTGRTSLINVNDSSRVPSGDAIDYRCSLTVVARATRRSAYMYRSYGLRDGKHYSG